MSPAKPMARRSSATASRRPASGFDGLSDLGREQLALAMDASSALFRGFEAIRGIQQQAAQQASTRHQAAADRLREAASPVDWMLVPFALLQQDLQSAAKYWQELTAAVLETQTELMECAGDLINTDAILESASAVEVLDAVPGVTQLFPRRARS